MTSLRFSSRPNRAHEIQWWQWGEAAFERARAEDKPVLLSISAVWCHWCHVMDETSYSDLEVIRLIDRLFIPIRVDNDQRPDINARYNMGGWPTTAFLTPNGDVISGGTYMPPEQLKSALASVSESYKGQKEAIVQRAQELRERRIQRATRPASRQELGTHIVDNVSEAVTRSYDEEYGGFGSQPKFPMTSAAELLLHLHQTTGATSYRTMLEKTLDSMLNGGLRDHEEGGFFRYSTTRDWSIPHYEKMLEDNVRLLRLYTRAHLATGKEVYARVASGIVDYLNGRLCDSELGAFYGSQDADEAYYAIPLAERLRRVPPAADRVFYTGLNAMVASAFLEAAWVLDRPNLSGTALRILEYLLEGRRGTHLRHSYSAEGSSGIPALLADYAHLVIGLVDAYSYTSQGLFLDQGKSSAEEMMYIFWDEQAGGFFDIPADPHAVGNLKVREVLLIDNVPAIDSLMRLYDITHEGQYRQTAETALRSFTPGYEEYGEAAAGYALSVNRFLHPTIEVSVVGKPGSPDTKAMLTACTTLPYPHTTNKLMDADDTELLEDEGYWAGDKAQAYVCLDTVCLAPISDPDALQETVAQLMGSNRQGAEDIFQTLGNGG